MVGFHAVTGNHDPWQHQAKTWDALAEGPSVVVSTAAASGKTFAFAPGIFEGVARRGDTALLLYPLVDLAVS